MAEIARNILKYLGWSLVVMKCAVMRMTRNVSYAKKNCRNRRERVRGFRNSRCMVAVTSAYPKAVVTASRLC